jgi:myo-inositol-1(or 4)-monophosphatase
MHPIVNIAVSAARKAGDIILRHMDEIDRLNITEKQANDFFTEVDVRAEQAIIETIHKAYPNHSIIAEESGIDEKDAEYTWLIDPLDGTKNYLHGFPFFSVSIAVKHKSKIEHGVIFDPLRKECFSASRGGGAKLNDRRIRVTKQNKLDKALLGTGFPFRNKELMNKYFATFQELFTHSSGIRRAGSAALDLAYVACGRLDGFWEFNLKPWDIAAGALLIREAGGLVSDLSGGESFLQTGNIVAANPKLFKSILQRIDSALVNNS